MLSKAKIKSIRDLRLKKHRVLARHYIIEGEKILDEALGVDVPIVMIVAEKEWLSNHAVDIRALKDVEIHEVTPDVLQQISGLETPNQVLAVCVMPEESFVYSSLQGQLALVLDTVQEPGNFGTIIRTAEWFGIKQIICSEHTVDMYNPKAIQAAMGSLFRVKISYMPLVPFLQEYATTLGHPVYGALLNGADVYKKVLSAQGLIIMGNESKGISADLLPYITYPLCIPSYSLMAGYPNSLNVSVATAIMCAEFKRRDHSK